MTNGIQPPSLLCNVNGAAKWSELDLFSSSRSSVRLLSAQPARRSPWKLHRFVELKKNRGDRGSVKEVAGEQHLGSNNVTAWWRRSQKIVQESKIKDSQRFQISKARMSEKRYSHDFYTLRPKPRGCKSTASPSTRRFGSARPRQNAYGLRNLSTAWPFFLGECSMITMPIQPCGSISN